MQPLPYRPTSRSPWAAALQSALPFTLSAHMPEPEPDNVPLPPTPHQPPSPDAPPEIIEPPDPSHEVPVRDPALPGAYDMAAFHSSSPIRYPQP